MQGFQSLMRGIMPGGHRRLPRGHAMNLRHTSTVTAIGRATNAWRPLGSQMRLMGQNSLYITHRKNLNTQFQQTAATNNEAQSPGSCCKRSAGTTHTHTTAGTNSNTWQIWHICLYS